MGGTDIQSPWASSLFTQGWLRPFLQSSFGWVVIESAGEDHQEWLDHHTQPGVSYELIKPGYRMRFLKLVP